MKKMIFSFLVLLTFAQCRYVTGVVCDETGTPVKGAMVSIDCSPKADQTTASGYFKFKVRSAGKTCKIRAWNPKDSTGLTTIEYYVFKAKSIELTLKRKPN